MARAKKKQQEETIGQTVEEAIVSGEVIAEEGMIVEETAAEETVEGVAEETAETEAAELPAITPDDLRLVEAILFASAGALTASQIAERFPADRVGIIPDVLEMLKEQYSGRGVQLVQRDKRWAFRTAVDLADQLRLEKEQPRKFTRAAMETMAVIAYHQPVTRAEIENIRGVATSPGSLDALMEAGWIKPGKRREVPGRPVTWLTTQAFLDHFGLEKLEDLPGMDELKAAGLLDKRPAIEAMPTADMFGEDENKQELDDPQEVTDEDLIGKAGDPSEDDEDEDFEGSETDEFDDEDGDSDDEDSADEDFDGEETDELDEEDSDEEYDDEDDEDDGFDEDGEDGEEEDERE